ncbi:hypothetical protein C8F04DRAFT_1233206 [Mycena alexandri]|uniref:Uncharacterized protein n=1 Tax=Mycena alexandri TaxID=1745969 RepID=A0AAD6SY84_9AGAR|nr:hypothetical protein C8F04DRAFT_1233206 [Mycena alexandri]
MLAGLRRNPRSPKSFNLLGFGSLTPAAASWVLERRSSLNTNSGAFLQVDRNLSNLAFRLNASVDVVQSPPEAVNMPVQTQSLKAALRCHVPYYAALGPPFNLYFKTQTLVGWYIDLVHSSRIFFEFSLAQILVETIVKLTSLPRDSTPYTLVRTNSLASSNRLEFPSTWVQFPCRPLWVLEIIEPRGSVQLSLPWYFGLRSSLTQCLISLVLNFTESGFILSCIRYRFKYPFYTFRIIARGSQLHRLVFDSEKTFPSGNSAARVRQPKIDTIPLPRTSTTSPRARAHSILTKLVHRVQMHTARLTLARMKADSIEFELELTYCLSNVRTWVVCTGIGLGWESRAGWQCAARARVPRTVRAGTSRRAAVPTPVLSALRSLIRHRVTRRRRRAHAAAASARAPSESETGTGPASEPAAALARIPRVRRAGELGPRTPPQLASTCAGIERTRTGTASAASASGWCAPDAAVYARRAEGGAEVKKEAMATRAGMAKETECTYRNVRSVGASGVEISRRLRRLASLAYGSYSRFGKRKLVSGCRKGGKGEKVGMGGKELPTVLCAKHRVHLLVALVARRAVERECGCAVDADNDVGMGSALRPLRETVRERGSQRRVRLHGAGWSWRERSSALSVALLRPARLSPPS